MPIVATVAIDLLDMAVLLHFAALSQHHARERRSTAGPFHYWTLALHSITIVNDGENAERRD